uniref:Uncharacterized protein n=1 Tax=Nelumbo nucifera TaxID=4432 RepID=A0A822ZJR6_NELNU|nr:TPA_asm: hypothetical protein HUJ06_001840 [Nelumbo nucifera]
MTSMVEDSLFSNIISIKPLRCLPLVAFTRINNADTAKLAKLGFDELERTTWQFDSSSGSKSMAEK